MQNKYGLMTLLAASYHGRHHFGRCCQGDLGTERGARSFCSDPTDCLWLPTQVSWVAKEIKLEDRFEHMGALRWSRKSPPRLRRRR